MNWGIGRGCGEELWEAVEGSITQPSQSNDGSSDVLTTLFSETREVYRISHQIERISGGGAEIDAVVIVALHSYLLHIYCSVQFKSSAVIEKENNQFVLLQLLTSAIIVCFQVTDLKRISERKKKKGTGWLISSQCYTLKKIALSSLTMAKRYGSSHGAQML